MPSTPAGQPRPVGHSHGGARHGKDGAAVAAGRRGPARRWVAVDVSAGEGMLEEIIDLATSYNVEEPLFDCVNVEYVYMNSNYSHSMELAKKAGINFYYTPSTQAKKN